MTKEEINCTNVRATSLFFVHGHSSEAEDESSPCAVASAGRALQVSVIGSHSGLSMAVAAAVSASLQADGQASW